MKKLFFLLIFCFFAQLNVAQTARIKGVILDEFNSPIENVSVKIGETGTVTNANGFYSLEIPANKDVTIVFSHVTFKDATLTVNLKTNEDFEFHPVLNSKVTQISEVIVTGDNKKRIEGIIAIDPVLIRKIPGANAGIENIVKTF